MRDINSTTNIIVIVTIIIYATIVLESLFIFSLSIRAKLTIKTIKNPISDIISLIK